MGRFATLSNFLRRGDRSDTRCNPGGGATVDAYHMQPAGDDSHPLPKDDVALVEVQRSNNFAAVGYRDPLNLQTAQAGERRVYARDPSSGEQVCEAYFYNDGRIKLSNDAGFVDLSPNGTIQLNNTAGAIMLLPGGSVNINGLIISPNGLLTDANGITLHLHSHTQQPDSGGNNEQRTDQASMP